MVEKKLGPLMQLQELSKTTEEKLTALGFVVEYPDANPWILSRHRAAELMRTVPPFVTRVAIVGGVLQVLGAIAAVVLGGALGNLSDRLFRGDAVFDGEVVDFVKVGIWPVFNLADSCIVVGGVLLAILLGRAERHQDQDQAPADRDRA